MSEVYAGAGWAYMGTQIAGRVFAGVVDAEEAAELLAWASKDGVELKQHEPLWGAYCELLDSETDGPKARAYVGELAQALGEDRDALART